MITLVAYGASIGDMLASEGTWVRDLIWERLAFGVCCGGSTSGGVARDSTPMC